MEVGIRVSQPGDPVLHVASCRFTMVAASARATNARSAQLPPLGYIGALEDKRARRAEERRIEYRAHVPASQEPPRLEEFELPARLHRVQEEPGFDGLLAGRVNAPS